MKKLASAVLLLLSTSAFAQQAPAPTPPQDPNAILDQQMGQIVRANANLMAQNAKLQARVDDLTKKLANMAATAPAAPAVPAPAETPAAQ